MTPEEFKVRWESDDNGGGITFDDIAECVKEWGLYPQPRTMRMETIRYAALKHAKCIDAEEFCPKAIKNDYWS